jgi:hypothetical protein
VPKSRKMGSGAVENRGKSWSGGVLWALGGLVDDDGKRSMALAIGDWSFSSVSQHE